MKITVANLSSNTLVVPAPLNLTLTGGKAVTVVMKEQDWKAVQGSAPIARLIQAKMLALAPIADAPVVAEAATEPAPAPKPVKAAKEAQKAPEKAPEPAPAAEPEATAPVAAPTAEPEVASEPAPAPEVDADDKKKKKGKKATW